MLLLWSTVVNLLVHDYDLILLVPLLEMTPKLVTAILLSIPDWWVILSGYSNDAT